MGLVLKDTIRLNTPTGVSEVQLLFGDITKLPLQEKVDFIFVSAFPGDYTPVPGTLIHALSKNLDLSVGEVARHKEVEYRKTFNCWVSKPLPDNLPFKKLVCFERMTRFENLPQQISGVFRAMMAVFNNEEKTVITPLLATGNQGHSNNTALAAIISAACHWIKAGLPLKCLKIVVYATQPNTVCRQDESLLDSFANSKIQWESGQKQEISKTEKKFDVCLSYSASDRDLAHRVCEELQKAHNSIIIHQEHFTYNKNKVWQDQIFTVMAQSYKIVAILTPSYVDKEECLEEFNLALCCNRLTGAEVLAPFYLQTVDSFPSYMTLIQYTECRARKEGEKAEEKLFIGCTMLVKEIDKNKISSSDKPSSLPDMSLATFTGHPAPAQPSREYDVFISYSHRNPEEAFKLYEDLLDLAPDLKVFLDRSELNTGNDWQETLYEALDSAKVVVAFVTKGYLASIVCKEEFNIALARYLSEAQMYLLPLLMDTDLAEIPAKFCEAPLVSMDNPSKRFEEQFCRLAEKVIQWLTKLKEGYPESNKFCDPPEGNTPISQITSKWREKYFAQRFHLTRNSDVALRHPPTLPSSETSWSSKTVVFSCTKDCSPHAAVIAHFLEKELRMSIKCEFLLPPEGSERQAPKLQLLDLADMIVLFVSDEYLASSQHRHELHIALGRQRTCKDKRIVYLIESFHIQPRPVYSHLLPYTINIIDALWAAVASHTARGCSRHIKQVPHAYLGLAQHDALYCAAMDIVDRLLNDNKIYESAMSTNIVNLVQMRDGTQDDLTVSHLKNLMSFFELTGLDLTAPYAEDPSEEPKEDANEPGKTPSDSHTDLESQIVKDAQQNSERQPKAGGEKSANTVGFADKSRLKNSSRDDSASAKPEASEQYDSAKSSPKNTKDRSGEVENPPATRTRNSQSNAAQKSENTIRSSLGDSSGDKEVELQDLIENTENTEHLRKALEEQRIRRELEEMELDSATAKRSKSCHVL